MRRILRRTWRRPADFPKETAFVRFLSPPFHAGRAIHGPCRLFFSRHPAAGSRPPGHPGPGGFFLFGRGILPRRHGWRAVLAAEIAWGYAAEKKRHVVQALLWCWLVTLAAVVSGTEPLPSERLVVRGLDGTAMPFADLIGPDGRAVCFAFLHPACPLAQEYGPVLGRLAASCSPTLS
jgi:hypothetical protein